MIPQATSSSCLKDMPRKSASRATQDARPLATEGQAVKAAEVCWGESERVLVSITKDGSEKGRTAAHPHLDSPSTVVYPMDPLPSAMQSSSSTTTVLTTVRGQALFQEKTKFVSDVIFARATRGIGLTLHGRRQPRRTRRRNRSGG